MFSHFLFFCPRECVDFPRKEVEKVGKTVEKDEGTSRNGFFAKPPRCTLSASADAACHVGFRGGSASAGNSETVKTKLMVLHHGIHGFLQGFDVFIGGQVRRVGSRHGLCADGEEDALGAKDEFRFSFQFV